MYFGLYSPVAILPPETINLPGYETAARMIPASEVGGDYYDVRPLDDGGWIAIGDVSGHGLTAGLVMMMVQTSVASLTLDDTHTPGEVAERVNRVVYDNVWHRLGTKDYVTFSLLRLRRDGRAVVVGRHAPIIVHRAATQTCEIIDPEGYWLGIKRSLEGASKPIAFDLAVGDTLVLHTDGVTESANATCERYGLDRLIEAVDRHAGQPVAALRDEIERDVNAFSAARRDDLTLLVIRHLGAAVTASGSSAPT